MSDAAADGGFLRAAFADGGTSGTAVGTAGVGGGAACFVATWTSFKLGRDSGWFSCSAIQTSKPAAIAPAGASHCQRAPLNRRTRRDFFGGAAPAAPWLWPGAAAAGKASTFRGAITGCEALLRWIHPTRGLLLPGEFIPIAEETGLIVPIGEWVLQTACAQLQRWLRGGLPQLDLAVNLSARQFNHRDLGVVVTKALDESGLDPARLKLELTESMVMGYSPQTQRTIDFLKHLGIELSIDDFGTGYSSLAYLKRFPCTSLKIDRSFVQDVTTDPDDAAIATAIISLAHNLRMRVIAEGIETEGQRQFLERERCDEGQGFFFSRPVPADEFLLFVKRT